MGTSCMRKCDSIKFLLDWNETRMELEEFGAFGDSGRFRDHAYDLCVNELCGGCVQHCTLRKQHRIRD